MLHFITNTTARVQPRQLCSRKQNSNCVLHFVAAENAPFLGDAV
jgi:hypothetical protein